MFDYERLKKDIAIAMENLLRKWTEENDEQFTNSETFTYTEAFDAHCDKMIESCKLALKCFGESINEDFPKLLLTFNIREYLDNEERIEAFLLINSKEATKEYMEHIDDFN